MAELKEAVEGLWQRRESLGVKDLEAGEIIFEVLSGLDRGELRVA